MSRYEPVIGLEIHAQIHTASKMFCACPVVEDTGDLPPNTYVCPICTGMPGTLPVINQRAVELTILTGLALNCEISPVSRFARKSYFYPDLPKGYQISQHALPLARHGHLDIEVDGVRRRVRINNVHLEEDTGKLYHVGGVSLVDFNRAGVPLMEIVTEPDMHSAEEVRVFATRLREILIYLGINSGDMEKGVMRFEASVSVRPAGTDILPPRHEIKNLNSFRALTRAVAYEIARQIEILESGGEVRQETMGWDEVRGTTYTQRTKEYAHDYRYFPEPDLPPLEVSREWVEDLRQQLPELPEARRARLIEDHGLGAVEAGLLVEDKAVADFYEAALAVGGVAPKTLAHWITGDLFRLMKESHRGITEIPISPEGLVELIQYVERGTVNLNTGREILEEMAATGKRPGQIIEEKGLSQISDEATLRQVIEKVLDQHPDQVQQYLGGKIQVAGWLMGQVMKATRGRANPHQVRSLLNEALEHRRSSG